MRASSTYEFVRIWREKKRTVHPLSHAIQNPSTVFVSLDKEGTGDLNVYMTVFVSLDKEGTGDLNVYICVCVCVCE